jgi:glutamate 5-kinase
MTSPSLKTYKRITVKIGSALLVDRNHWPEARMARFDGRRHRRLAEAGADVLVVSSGAIALGRTILGLGKRALKLEESQAAAAVGQIALAGAWSEELGARG